MQHAHQGNGIPPSIQPQGNAWIFHEPSENVAYSARVCLAGDCLNCTSSDVSSAEGNARKGVRRQR